MELAYLPAERAKNPKTAKSLKHAQIQVKKSTTKTPYSWLFKNADNRLLQLHRLPKKKKKHDMLEK